MKDSTVLKGDEVTTSLTEVYVESAPEGVYYSEDLFSEIITNDTDVKKDACQSTNSETFDGSSINKTAPESSCSGIQLDPTCSEGWIKTEPNDYHGESEIGFDREDSFGELYTEVETESPYCPKKEETDLEITEKCITNVWIKLEHDSMSRKTVSDGRHSKIQNIMQRNKHKSRFNRKKRVRNRSRGKVYECHECSYSCSERSALIIHLRTHSGEKPFECRECGKGFASTSGLCRHMRTHSGEKPHVCKECEKRFACTSGLNRHLRIHSGEKPYECKVCEKKFGRSGNLKIHMRTHSGEKPYVCKECGKGFIVSGQLSSHMRIHSGERPYECKICLQRFRQSGTLKVHIRLHSGEKPYECKECFQRYRAIYTLRKHMRTHSSD